MKIGIRAEDKSRWEARIPLVPEHLGTLVGEQGLDIVVQPSAQRTFREEEFTAAGVTVQADLSDRDLVMGVKEMPMDQFQPGKTYLFFSHTIKGQPYNMDMLRDLMAKGCNLLDYETIVDEQNRRLVFFGVHAGLAGMVDSIWSLGQRLAAQGVQTPLAELLPAVKYPSLDAAKTAIAEAAAACNHQRSLESIGPVVIGVTGNGRVSKGAQEISALLAPIPITPAELLADKASEAGTFYQVIFEEQDMVRAKGDEAFDLQTYYESPERFEGRFADYLPHLSMLVNCIYWEDKYPRLVTKDDLRGLYADGAQPKLRVIGDISCDIEGSVEATVKPSDPGNPVYVYDVAEDAAVDGFEGHGPLIMAVEILPTEIPRESSLAFSEALMPMMAGLASSDPSGSFEDWALPEPLKRAVILHKGELTERFAYIAKLMKG